MKLPPHSLHFVKFIFMRMTQFCTAVPQTLTAIDSLQLSFHILEKQLSDLKLVLNCAKTKWILFTKARSTDFNSLKLCSTNGTTLERVTSYKYLGIWVDETLDFKSHVKQLTKKLRIKLFFFIQK